MTVETEFSKWAIEQNSPTGNTLPLNVEANQLRSVMESLGHDETPRSAWKQGEIEKLRQHWRYLQNLLLAGTHDPD